MKINKILEVRLDIDDVNDIYCQDYDKKYLQILKDKYINKCFKSVYILDILKIINRSHSYCKNRVLDGSIKIDIVFEVLGLVYEKGDVVHECKILQINPNGMMHAKSKYASLLIKNITEIYIFKELDEIPVIVNNTRYLIYDNELSISAIPLIPIVRNSIIYRVVDADLFVNDDVSSLFDLTSLETLKSDIDKISKANKNVFKFFRELLFPLKKPIKKIGSIKKVDMVELAQFNNGDMIYIQDSYIDDYTYQVINDADKTKIETSVTTTLDISKQDLILYILEDYKKKLDHFHEFLQTYDSSEKIKNKSKVWTLYNNLKK